VAAELLFWEPGGTGEQTRNVSDAGEVEAVADELLARYQSANTLPGIELQASDGQSLSIAVGPSGWALIHTDTEFTQHCTKRTDSNGQPSADVQWDQITSIPDQWFIPKPSALAGVTQWLTDGTLAGGLPWTDECY
jgi:hypothetical protein